MKITYLKNSDPYDEYMDDCNIVTEDVSSLSDDKLSWLLGEILQILDQPGRSDAKKSVIGQINLLMGLISPNQVKLLENLKVKNSNLLFYTGNGYESVDVHCADIPEHVLRGIVQGGVDCYISVEPPENIQKQIDVYKKNLLKEQKRLEMKKKLRKIKAARKLLEEASSNGKEDL